MVFIAFPWSCIATSVVRSSLSEVYNCIEIQRCPQAMFDLGTPYSLFLLSMGFVCHVGYLSLAPISTFSSSAKRDRIAWHGSLELFA